MFRVSRSTVRHFGGNVDALQNLEPEGVHQMRVGLRRLRAAMSLFSQVLPRQRSEKIKPELKWLTKELAPAREIDVFVKEKISRATRDVTPRRGGKEVEKEFVTRRAEALERARKAVNSERGRAPSFRCVGMDRGKTYRHREGRGRSYWKTSQKICYTDAARSCSRRDAALRNCLRASDTNFELGLKR
jgi:inorganic triphosphatase YgiF